MRRAVVLLVGFVGASCGDDSMPTEPSGPTLGFFVTSATSVTGNLGGLADGVAFVCACDGVPVNAAA